MAKIDMRDGSIIGRMMGVVGATWKGINYTRKFVVPNNPQSVDQTAVRTVFAGLVSMGRRINSTILKDYILPAPKRMSQFNEFIARNQAMIDAGVFTRDEVKIGVGSLYAPADVSLATAAPAGLIFTWGTGLQGEAAATDHVIICVYNQTTDKWFFSTAVQRSAGTATIANVGLDTHVVDWFLFFTQGTTLSSETTNDQDTIAAA